MATQMLVVVAVAVLANVAAAAGCKTVTTFNTALTTRVDNYWNRRGIIADALAAESADVLCLQELWFEDDMRHLVDDLKSIYPYHYSGIHTELNKLEDDSGGWSRAAHSACSWVELLSILYHVLPCAYREGCLSVFGESSEAGLGCLAQKCAEELGHEDINPTCVSCLVISSSSFGDVADRCHKVFGSDLRMNPSGLLMFSKTELPEPPTTIYKSYFPGQKQVLHRGYIQTEVKDIGTVVCTHLTSVFPHYWEYDLSFSSYEEQNQVEINITQARLGNSDHLLAADFNTGPAVSSSDPEKNLKAEAPQSHALLEQYGYDVETYLTDDGRCTYCSSNSLVTGYNNAIDDVLVMGNAFSTVTKQRVLDQRDPSLSDHYGVRARLCKS